jgi:hypothetical protein
MDKGSASWVEVDTAAVMDVLRGLEDEMVTDEEVVDEGLTDVEVAFEEVLLVLLVLMLEEEEVGFCISC